MTTINQDFAMYAGDDRFLSCSVVDSTGAAQSLVGITSLVWTLRTAPGATALLTKGIGTGITVTNAAGGLYTIALDTLNTATLSGRYYHKAVLTDSVADITTIMEGWVTIEVASKIYITLASLKRALNITGTTDDGALMEKLEEASRAVDDICGRRFYSATETRYYTALNRHFLAVDDLLSVTTLQTDDDSDDTYENTWAITDYVLAPYNASAEGNPYWRIEKLHNGGYDFPVHVRRGVKITGVFGYSTVPAPVAGACRLLAARLWNRPNAPFGVTGSADLGMIRVNPRDPDIVGPLAPYMLVAVA
jgi:hypothetical protein